MNLQNPVKYHQIPGKPTRATVSNPGRLITILKGDNRRSFELTRSLTREEIDLGIVDLNNSESWVVTSVSEDLETDDGLLYSKQWRGILKRNPRLNALPEDWK